MTTIVRSVLVLFSTVGCLIAPAATWADELQFALDFNGKYVDPKSIWTLATISKDVPINRQWKDLSKEQRDAVKSVYEPMPEDDEPPFPADGLEPILRALVKIQEFLQDHGKLSVAVDVGVDGIATSVALQGTPTAGMKRFVSEYFLLTRYKPAVCGGQPCRMQYAFSMVFSNEPEFHYRGGWR